ncbi:hypothetical protein CEXT_283461 [Caerostris extrusa]|uniref:Uncharacterized protein n=1 Tax=Caerostris extrusa TaxID=172846 RepID=A0AAV4VYX7_CAEEX|nr:hypothetical protein CEXT_283461 [Caerostris extrusa]
MARDVFNAKVEEGFRKARMLQEMMLQNGLLRRIRRGSPVKSKLRLVTLIEGFHAMTRFHGPRTKSSLHKTPPMASD